MQHARAVHNKHPAQASSLSASAGHPTLSAAAGDLRPGLPEFCIERAHRKAAAQPTDSPKKISISPKPQRGLNQQARRAGQVTPRALHTVT